MTIIQNPTEPDRDELVAERAHVAVEREPFEVDVRHPEDGRARGLVAPSGLDPDEPVLDNVSPADAVLPREQVERREDVNGVGVRLAVGGGDFDGETGLELNVDVIGFRGGGFDRLGELPHVYGRGRVGIFEDAGFVRNVEEVFVRRPGFGCGLLNGDLLFGGVREEGLTTGEAVVKLFYDAVSALTSERLGEPTGETPWGDDFDVWFETVKCELETNLVVSFACATV